MSLQTKRPFCFENSFVSVDKLKKSKMKKIGTHKEIAVAINHAVQNGDAAAIATWVKENYIQHTPVVADGRAGLVGLVTKIKNKEIPAPVIKTVRTIEDGEFIVLQNPGHPYFF